MFYSVTYPLTNPFTHAFIWALQFSIIKVVHLGIPNWSKKTNVNRINC